MSHDKMSHDKMSRGELPLYHQNWDFGFTNIPSGNPEREFRWDNVKIRKMF
jgi:hypothetical protein